MGILPLPHLPEDPPKPHTLMALNGAITPRSERSEVFFWHLHFVQMPVARLGNGPASNPASLV